MMSEIVCNGWSVLRDFLFEKLIYYVPKKLKITDGWIDVLQEDKTSKQKAHTF